MNGTKKPPPKSQRTLTTQDKFLSPWVNDKEEKGDEILFWALIFMAARFIN